MVRAKKLRLSALFAPEAWQRRFFFLAGRFVAGETIESALEATRRLNAAGLTVSLDFLGEDITNAAEADETLRTYLQTLTAIREAGVRANISLKLTALGLLVDEERCLERLRAITACARRNADPFVRIDMEGSALTQKTLDIFERAHATDANLGPVIQASLRRSPSDIARLVTLGARVRLCKGAYREPASIALHDAREIRHAFLRCAEALLRGGTYPAIATHDERLIEAVRSFAQTHAIDKRRFEFQLLYGVRPDLQHALAGAGYNVRIYVPFGTHWGRYFYRRISERRENALFALRALVAGEPKAPGRTGVKPPPA